MIHYVVENNPDGRIIDKASQALIQGGIICFPTDTNWVLAASPFCKAGVENLYRVKGIDRKKNLSLLCNKISQASQYAIISNQTYRTIKRVIPGPYTFVFNPTRDIPRIIKEHRGSKEIGIRLPKSVLCSRLLENNPTPLLTTSITLSMLQTHFFDDDPNMPTNSDILSYQIEDAIGNWISMILDPCDVKFEGESTIIDFSKDDTPQVLREGAGDISFFT